MATTFLSKFKNKHFLSLAGNGIMTILGMVMFALLYRALSIADIGIWVFFLSTYLLVDAFRSGFITTAFIKFYAGTDAARSAEVVGSTWVIAYAITGGLSLLSLAGLFFMNKINEPGLSLFFKWFAITYIANLPSFMATCVVQAEQRFDRLLYIRIVNQGLFILFVIFVIVTHTASLQNIVYANIASSALASLFTIITGWDRMRAIKYRTKKGIAELFHFGKYSVGTSLSSNLFRYSDVYIINAMLGPAALAIYNLGQKLMEVVEIPLRSFAATGMPQLSMAYNQSDKGQVIYIMKKYAGMVTLALIPVCIMTVLFADIAIEIIGGKKYAGTEAANILRLFMTFALLYPLDRFLALTLDVIHKPKINFIKVLIMLGANIAGDIIGIKVFGNIYGVAITTVIPTMIGVSIGYWALNRYCNFNLVSVYKVGYTELRPLIRQLLLRFKLIKA